MPAAESAEKTALDLLDPDNGATDYTKLAKQHGATRAAQLMSSAQSRIGDEKGFLYRASQGYYGGEKKGEAGHAEYLQRREAILSELMQPKDAPTAAKTEADAKAQAALLQAVEQLPKKLASEMRQTPIQVRMPPDPNAPKANR
jgi:hypothetical protein